MWNLFGCQGAIGPAGNIGELGLIGQRVCLWAVNYQMFLNSIGWSHLIVSLSCVSLHVCAGRARPRGRGGSSWSRRNEGENKHDMEHKILNSATDSFNLFLGTNSVNSIVFVYILRVTRVIWVRRATKEKRVKLDWRERKAHLEVLDSLASE